MNSYYQDTDKQWKPLAPEPLWVGWRLNTPSCCRIRFRGKDGLDRYEAHYMETHWYEHGSWCSQSGGGDSDAPFMHGSTCERDDSPTDQVQEQQ